ncbi:MarR family winged helix-turn-helix transcriptional regulator [Lacticaseibacillus songhuajiangensis]|jgi:DNA-binding MarR family transcriptional regulator|uniref:MarR family winged helix-turn-helix transcriptional regulator n=1 Tax=Lacticaseibacillus songhuajiangensis TaxID=1296539 RepID=UPI000F787961|nr:MarR family winged helix-turn-helix transcriptional regulator [Lacticaseibacillus songhuajiangensis]
MDVMNPETVRLRAVDEAIIDKFTTLSVRMAEVNDRVQLSKTMSTVTKGQGRVLSVVALHPQITQKELVDLLHIRAASVSELLSKLLSKGLVRRRTSRRDRRKMMISLTPAGECELKRYKLLGAAMLADLTEEERVQLDLIIGKLISSVKLRSTVPV